MKKFVGVAVVALFAACGGGDSGGGGGVGATTSVYCVIAGDMCSQVTKAAGFSSTDLTTLQSECATALGTYGVGACSTTGTVTGYCYYSDFAAWTGVAVTGATMSDYYYTATWTPTTAAGDCGGVWTGGGGGGGGGATTVTESEPNGTPGTADGPYSSDQVFGGAISPAGDVDVFAITNSSGAAVLVHFETFSAPGVCSGIDTVVEILNSSSTVLASNDDSGIGFCSSLDYSIPAGTTVYARVKEWAGGTITAYQLWVNFP